MINSINKFKIKEVLDKILLINLFLVIFFAIFFLFSIILKFGGVDIVFEYFQVLWNPLIIPLITILIISSLLSGINSWLRRKLLPQEDDT